MARYFSMISEKELKEIVLKQKKLYGDEDGDYYAWPKDIPSIAKDLKVDFDWENFEERKEGNFGPPKLMGLNTLKNGFTFWGMCAGGDWESPVFFALYFDGKRLRAYVPTKGNPYNTDTMLAYGNSESDKDNMIRRNDLPLPPQERFNWFDEKMIVEDIMERIKEKQ